MTDPLKIKSKVKNYEVFFQHKTLSEPDSLRDFFHERTERLFFLIDSNVHSIYSESIDKLTQNSSVLLIEAIEGNKDFSELSRYISWLIESGITRKDTVVTIGGGILQDISGFISCILYRGVQWFYMPTTLLSLADSCIGSKTSINFMGSKNLIGTFYPPDIVINDIDFCKTLTCEYFNSGIGEIIKFHLLGSVDDYQRLIQFIFDDDLRNSVFFEDIVLSTLKIKKFYFEGDEFDIGKRNLLNYGHCFGHALESATNFSVCHGEAVIVGMGFANILSLKRGLINDERYSAVEEMLKRHYPAFDHASLSVETIINQLKKDKKREGKDLTVICLGQAVGDAVKLTDVTEDEIRGVFNDFFPTYQAG